MAQIEMRAREDLCLDWEEGGEFERLFEASYASLFMGKIMLSNGAVLEQLVPGILRSGSLITLSANSRGNIILKLMYHYERGIEFRMSEFQAACLGDDVNETLQEEIEEADYAKFHVDKGIAFKEIETHRTMEGMKWCSMTFFRNDRGRLVWKPNNPVKHQLTLKYWMSGKDRLIEVLRSYVPMYVYSEYFEPLRNLMAQLDPEHVKSRLNYEAIVEGVAVGSALRLFLSTPQARVAEQMAPKGAKKPSVKAFAKKVERKIEAKAKPNKKKKKRSRAKGSGMHTLRAIDGTMQLELPIPQTGGRAFKVHQGKDGCKVRGCDLIGPVQSLNPVETGQQIGNVIYSQTIAVGLVANATLKAMAQLYTKYKIKFKIRYVSQAGSAQPGTIGMYFDPNPNNNLLPPPVDGSPQQDQLSACSSSNYWSEFPVNAAGSLDVMDLKQQEWLFTNLNYSSPIADLSTIYAGVFSILSNFQMAGSSDPTVFGTLYLEYEVQFVEKCAIPPSQAVAQSFNNNQTTSGNLWQASPALNSGSNLPLQLSVDDTSGSTSGTVMLPPGNYALEAGTNGESNVLTGPSVSLDMQAADASDVDMLMTPTYYSTSVNSAPTTANFLSMLWKGFVKVLPTVAKAAVQVLQPASLGNNTISWVDVGLSIFTDVLGLAAQRQYHYKCYRKGALVCEIKPADWPKLAKYFETVKPAHHLLESLHRDSYLWSDVNKILKFTPVAYRNPTNVGLEKLRLDFEKFRDSLKALDVHNFVLDSDDEKREYKQLIVEEKKAPRTPLRVVK